MRIDVDRLHKTIDETKRTISDSEEALKSSDVWRLWKKLHRWRANLGSRPQLAVVLEGMGHELKRREKTNRAIVDEKALEGLAQELPFVKDYLRLEKLKNLLRTYLKGIEREVVDGFLHPIFNLHLVKTYRSSSDSPNFQNIPTRDEESGRLVRSCFVPRDDHVLIETDYSALEFRVAACFWRDGAMVAYASDSTLDVHRDMAMECYMLSKNEVTKPCRFYAKNQFVFPELYGSYYVNCARNLWNAIDSGDLKTSEGVGLHNHLEEKGIDRLGRCNPGREPELDTFERHVKRVESDFHKRFPQWAERKVKWWERYKRTGSFRMMTGFECSGVFTRNELYNWPIQGPAFHLLLWSLIQLQRWLVKGRMQSRIIGQIHDSIVADVHRDELDDYLAESRRIMTEDVKTAYPWVVTPMEIEVEMFETNWFEKVSLA